MIAALAALRGEIPRSDVASFVERHGMPGYSPTQGHIASAVPFLAHAREKIVGGEMANACSSPRAACFWDV
jgi:betaine reductase